MATVDLRSEDSRLVADRQRPATLALIGAGFLSFLIAAATIFDAYGESPTLSEPPALAGPPARPEPTGRDVDPPAPPARPEPTGRDVDPPGPPASRPGAPPDAAPKGADPPPRSTPPPAAADNRDILTQILDRQAETQVQVAAIRRELSERPSTPATVSAEELATIERHLGAIAEQAGALEELVAARMPREARPEVVTAFRRLRASVAAAQRAAVRARNDGPEAAARGGAGEAALAASAESSPPLFAATLAVAPAASDPGSAPSAAELAWFKVYVTLGIFAVLGIAFLIAAGAIFTTSNPATFAFATDTIKTMLGFFIGVATAFLGAPS